eukprot:g18102.t1
MKWPTKGKRSKGKKKKDEFSSPAGNMGPPAAVTPNSNGVGLGTLRLGMVRSKSFSVSTPTPTSRRQLISELLGAESEGETDEPVTASPALRSMISRKSSTNDTVKDLNEEKAVFASHLNAHLTGDPFLKHILPLDPGGADFFDSFKDGVLMCRIVCLAIPGSIADAEINAVTGDEPLSLYRSNENLNVALQAAEAGGLQVVNIGASDIIQGRPASILGLTWQLIRVHLLAQINLKGCPDLIHLMEEGEEKEEFFKLPVEEVLLRWFNHHLRWGGSERRVSNFGEDLADGKCYLTLVKELNDNFRGEETVPNEKDPKRAQFRRACLVISGAEGIGLAPLIRANHITGKAHLYNIAFVAQLLNRRPRIHRESLHLDASIKMQAWFRMVRVMHRTSPILEERRVAAAAISRACRRWILIRNRQRAATALQAAWRGKEGRAVASSRRFAMAKEVAEEAEARASRQAAALEREAAMLERRREMAAATVLQAWTRGVETRNAVSAALEARGLPLLAAEQRRRASCGSNLKGSQIISPRTSVASSIRFSEDSVEPDGHNMPFGGGVAAASSWFDKVFSGMSFGLPDRSKKNPRRTDAAAAIVIQRWQRHLVQSREESARAQKELARRRWAADKLHAAYARRWRFEVAARIERRLKLEEEEEARWRLEGNGIAGALGNLWARMKRFSSGRPGLRGIDEGDGMVSPLKGWDGRRDAQKAKAREDADCCDVVGESVLASEIDAWNVSYLSDQVFGTPGKGEAQERRARALCKVDEKDPVSWSAPEEALTTGKVLAMLSVLLTVAFESPRSPLEAGASAPLSSRVRARLGIAPAMANDLQRCLKANWGHEKFRPHQLEVIEAAMAGRDAFVLMATGSGKSVCYQLPAVMQPRGQNGIGPVTVVVSPLISLMEDQVLSLKNNGISACLVGGSSDLRTEEKAIAGEFPLVFVTPEKVSLWDHGLKTMEAGPGLALFAVDESHCVAEWGHDFRPSYLELRCLRDRFPKVPIMALTATATPRVQTEIISNLRLRNPLVCRTSFNRWNLHYSVKTVNSQSRHQALSSLLKDLDGSAIVYVMTKKDAEQLAVDVGRIVGSNGARAYHGGMSHEDRKAVHHAFVRDEVQVVVATIAFGMGIDKPDVRTVIHCGLPKTVEAYYQQTGRAGRDGLPSKCILLFSRQDAVRQRSIMGMSTTGTPPTQESIERSNKQLAEMEKFATSPGCRRRAVLSHFGEDMGDAKCDGCDACDRAEVAAAASASGVIKSNEDVELFTAPARLVLQAVHDSGGRYGIGVPIGVLMGNKTARDRVFNATSKPSYGKGKQKGKTEQFWKALFHQLVERQGFLEAVAFSSNSGGRGGSTYRLTPAGRTFLSNTQAKLPVSFTPSDELAAEGRRLRTATADPAAGHPHTHTARDGLSSEGERKLHKLLMNLRKSLADREEVMPFHVLGGPVVRELCKRRPVDLATLKSVDGMSDKKVADYGAHILQVVRKACEDFKLETNVAAVTVEQSPWLTSLRENKPLTQLQRSAYEEYMRRGSLTLEEVAGSLPRPLLAGTMSGHLAACLEAGLAFEWDRHRLGIDPTLEGKIMGVVEHFKKEGHNPLSPGFRLKPIFEELPSDTDSKTGYPTIKLILARLRFESTGGRLPGSGGNVLRPPPTVAVSGKKRALPTWAGGSTAMSGGLPSAKKVSPPKAATSLSSSSSSPAAGASLFTPSYMPSPQSSASKARPAASPPASPPAPPVPPSSASTNVFTRSPQSASSALKTSAGAAAAGGSGSPPTTTGRLFTPSHAVAPAPAEVDLCETSAEPWTSGVVLRLIKEAGPSGATFEALVAANPGDESALRTLLDSLQEDFLLFTKPGEASGGAPVFLPLVFTHPPARRSGKATVEIGRVLKSAIHYEEEPRACYPPPGRLKRGCFWPTVYRRGC